jgi:RNA polymerase sigma-54 factor
MTYKQTVVQRQTILQTVKVNPSLLNRLQILGMSQEGLLRHIREKMEENPFIYYHEYVLPGEFQSIAAPEMTLKEYLFQQLHIEKKAYDETICAFIIESLNSKGFLPYSTEEYSRYLNVSPVRIEKQLGIIRALDPPGVAAANALESLKMRLERGGHALALKILEENLDDLAKHRFRLIAEKQGISAEEVKTCLELIARIGPYPAVEFQTDAAPLIFPDVQIVHENGRLAVSALEYGRFEKIEDHYRAIADDEKLRAYFNEAVVLIDEIEKRNLTLLMIMNEAVKNQKDFLAGGRKKRYLMGETARTLGIHVSTVSRCVSEKYYQYNGRIYPVKTLYSAKKTDAGGNAIQRELTRLISQEDPKRPLSDYELFILLKRDQITVARRTVAKYRIGMGIENSTLRKRERGETEMK